MDIPAGSNHLLRMVMEPKYYAFWRSLDTQIILWQGDWILAKDGKFHRNVSLPECIIIPVTLFFSKSSEDLSKEVFVTLNSRPSKKDVLGVPDTEPHKVW